MPIVGGGAAVAVASATPAILIVPFEQYTLTEQLLVLILFTLLAKFLIDMFKHGGLF